MGLDSSGRQAGEDRQSKNDGNAPSYRAHLMHCGLRCQGGCFLKELAGWHADLTPRGTRGYLVLKMRKARAIRALSVLLVATLLAAYLSPATAGMLICTADGTAPDCCRNSSNFSSSVPEEEGLLEGAGCNCCISVDANPYDVDASTQKSFLDVIAGAALFQNVALLPRSRVPQSVIGSGGDERLSSLRTVILRI
jgi:hypothetical protein